jgi:hypothetical protein
MRYPVYNKRKRVTWDTFCINLDPISLAKATVVKNGDNEGGFARETTAVQAGDGGGCPVPEFNASK